MSDATMTAQRRSSLEGRSGETAIGGVSLTACPPRTRLILRGEAAAGPAGTALGLEIPRRPNRAVTSGERAALWLGPDEWLILAPQAETASLSASLAGALAGVPHALVDVSHRQTAILLAGRGSEAALNAAVPLDLTEAAFPVGMATRTIFEKVEIVLWRTGAESFHVEVWRSFAPYVWTLLEAVRKENAAG
jgi:sarcosine oxidase, subunit gamma